MAKFNYRMQNILNIKINLETQAKSEFSAAAAKLTEEENKLKSLLSRRQVYEQQIRDLSTGKLDFIKIKQCNDAIESLKELLKKQAIQVRIAKKNLDLARQKLELAMQERKIHDKLKERAFDEFKQELEAQEKKEIDELVSYNYNDNNKETGD